VRGDLSFEMNVIYENRVERISTRPSPVVDLDMSLALRMGEKLDVR
jgi:hypothetical protein